MKTRGLLAFALVLIGSQASPDAWAGSSGGASFDDAMAQMTQGYNDFFRSFSASSSKSQSEASRLSQQFMGAPSAAVSQAMYESSLDTLKKAGVKIINNDKDSSRSPASDAPIGAAYDAFAAGVVAGSGTAAENGVISTAGKVGAQPVVQPGVARPEWVLDGSDIPSEIVFPGSPKTSTAKKTK